MKKLGLAAVVMFGVGSSGCGSESFGGVEMGSIQQALRGPGAYNVYYGHLHNHSNVSDGRGTPAQAYSYARDTARLDFFGLADHAGSISSREWTSIKNAANSANVDGVFTALWGFEWSSSGNYGHVTVVSTPDCTTESSPSTNTFAKLSAWLSTRDGVAFLNHPGREDTGHEFDHFDGTSYAGGARYTVADQVVGMELFNKSDGFDEYYYNDGYYAGDGSLSYIDEANIRRPSGWRLGAAGGDDNHTASWGTGTESRLAILATSLSRADLLAAMRARRFFSTSDRNLALSFVVGGQEMGSTLPAGTYDATIAATDGDGETFDRVEIKRNGVTVQRWTESSTNPNIAVTLTLDAGDNDYVVVHQTDGDEAISSPIFAAL